MGEIFMIPADVLYVSTSLLLSSAMNPNPWTKKPGQPKYPKHNIAWKKVGSHSWRR